jgi:hypothetical protein
MGALFGTGATVGTVLGRGAGAWNAGASMGEALGWTEARPEGQPWGSA